jgi:hypothetical protein
MSAALLNIINNFFIGFTLFVLRGATSLSAPPRSNNFVAFAHTFDLVTAGSYGEFDPVRWEKQGKGEAIRGFCV